MDAFTLAIKGLEAAAAAAAAYASARAIAVDLKTAAQQSKELTPEQSAELDAKAEAIFASPEAQPSGR